MKLKLGFVFLLAALVSGCGRNSNHSPDQTAATAPGEDSRWPAGDLDKVKAMFGEMNVSKSGLRWQILEPGTGDAKPLVRDVVRAHYRGALLNGAEFDESYKRGEPFEFPLGLGRVIPAWDEAILDMKKGEKRRLVVPYWLGYGVRGAGSKIPPKSTLVFEVVLVDWTPAPGH